MTQSRPTPAPWNADSFTTFYTAPPDADAVEIIEIRAHAPEKGWHTVAFVEETSPYAKANARLIAAAPKMLDALFDIKNRAQKSGDHEADPFALLDLILDDALAAIHLAIQE